MYLDVLDIWQLVLCGLAKRLEVQLLVKVEGAVLILVQNLEEEEREEEEEEEEVEEREEEEEEEEEGGQ
jgi:hypothetical protein